MPTVPVYSQDGQRTGALTLAPEVFDVVPTPGVLHEVVVAHEANRRRPIAHTKTRGEVRGGGKKPWAQKHTGRARHGSIRSPLWVGGGITFGPRSTRRYAVKVNAKVRRMATRMALSDKVANERFLVLEDLAESAVKTRTMAKLLTALTVGIATDRRRPSVLIALPTERRAIARGFGNLPRVRGMDVVHLNAYDVLRSDVLVTTRAGVARTTETFAPR